MKYLFKILFEIGIMYQVPETIRGYKQPVHLEFYEPKEVHEYDSTFVHYTWQRQKTMTSCPTGFCCTKIPNYFFSYK